MWCTPRGSSSAAHSWTATAAGRQSQDDRVFDHLRTNQYERFAQLRWQHVQYDKRRAAETGRDIGSRLLKLGKLAGFVQTASGGIDDDKVGLRQGAHELYAGNKRPSVFGFVGGLGGRDVLPQEFERILERSFALADKGQQSAYEMIGVRE